MCPELIPINILNLEDIEIRQSYRYLSDREAMESQSQKNKFKEKSTVSRC